VNTAFQNPGFTELVDPERPIDFLQTNFSFWMSTGSSPDAGLAISIPNVRAIAYQPACHCSCAGFICRRNCDLCSACHQEVALAVQKWTGADQKGVGAGLSQGIESSFDLATRLRGAWNVLK
jgi:hypothetical protein